MTTLTIGSKAPSITLLDQNGDTVKHTRFKGRKVLVFFYPKADTPGCTTQSCGLRDIAAEIGDTVIIGISPDPLLSDPEHTVSEAFGVWAEKSMYGKKYMGIVRSAFLIDEKGKLEQVWYKISPKDTPTNLLAALAG
ncbi:MAG: thioredoxin-dependent thiol peroxidase [Actinobacteria bacterium]|nr:thioredoxin-dependent thiol peroxidase [Actinomycetota bacterium]